MPAGLDRTKLAMPDARCPTAFSPAPVPAVTNGRRRDGLTGPYGALMDAGTSWSRLAGGE